MRLSHLRFAGLVGAAVQGTKCLAFVGSQLLLPIVGMILARLAVNYPGRLPKLMALISMITCLSVEIDYVSRLLGGLKIG